MSNWTALEPVTGLRLHLAVNEDKLCRLSFAVRSQVFLSELESSYPPVDWKRDDSDPVLREAQRQLRAYFSKELRQFHLPLDCRGTAFQKRVWQALQTIPYGQTRSYQQIAGQVGTPRASRAAGAACGANPVAIIVPCHRVLASDGTLCGFGGGLPVKRLLLDLESVRPARRKQARAASVR